MVINKILIKSYNNETTLSLALMYTGCVNVNFSLTHIELSIGIKIDPATLLYSHLHLRHCFNKQDDQFSNAYPVPPEHIQMASYQLLYFRYCVAHTFMTKSLKASRDSTLDLWQR